MTNITNAELTQMKERAEIAEYILWMTEGKPRCRYHKDYIEDVPRLVAEVERLQHEVGEHNGHLIATEIIPLKQENKRLQAEVERLREALDLATAYVPMYKKYEIVREALK